MYAIALTAMTCPLLSLASPSDTRRLSRIAVLNLTPQSAELAGLADLVEIELTHREGIEVVERELIATLLKEQELQSVGSAGDGSSGLKMGALLRAHLLVLFSASKDDEEGARLCILETRHGLKLVDETFPNVVSDLSPYVTTVTDTLSKALSQEKPEYYAVAPFVNRELSFRLDHYQDSVAHLIRQELLRRGRPVLEFEEARKLLDECEVSQGPTRTELPALTAIRGAILVTQTDRERLDLDLELTTLAGQRRHLEAQIPTDDRAAGEAIESLVDRILTDPRPPRPPPRSQSRYSTIEWLAACGAVHKRIGAWSEARQEFEAALLADPSSRTLRNDLILVYGELIKEVPFRTLPLVEEQQRLLALHGRGVDLIEWILRNARRLSNDDVVRITAFLQPGWWWRASLHHSKPARSLRDLDPAIRNTASEHMRHLRAVSMTILVKHDAELFRKHLGMTDACGWYLYAEPWIDGSVNDKYQQRLEVLSSVGDGVTEHVHWRKFLEPTRAPSAAESVQYTRYLRRVLRLKGCPKVAREAAAVISKRERSLGKRSPTKSKTSAPKQYPDCFTVAELHLVDSSTKEAFRPNHVSRVIRCGEFGDAVCLQRQVFFLASRSEATPILNWPKDDYGAIDDACWDGANLWLAISSHADPNGRDAVLCWNPESGVPREWGAAQGVPMEALGRKTQGALTRIRLCPLVERVLVAGAQRGSSVATRTWIGSITPDDEAVSVLFEARGISDRTREWEAHISDPRLGFVPLGMGIYQAGTQTEDKRLLIGRSAAYPLAVALSTGQVSVQQVPPPFVNVETMRFRDGRIAWRSTGTIHWSSASTFEILHSIGDLGHVTSWFEYRGSVLAYGHSIMWVDDHDMTVTQLVPDVFDLAPVFHVMAPSKHFGILGFNRKQRSFYAIAVDDDSQKPR